MKNNNVVSELDKKYLLMLRDNIVNFMHNSSKEYDKKGNIILDVAPQVHEGAAPFFSKSIVETLDISPSSGATYIADLCENNSKTISDNRFDIVVCTEVLEHTLQPFDAVDEIERILKPGGVALISVPCNFRIHGPLPDCWRFTEHGLRELFKKFDIKTIKSLDDEDRFLAPIQYTLVAVKKK